VSLCDPQKLRGSTGFTSVEVFRKYLWFLLRERQFDAAAVEDMVLLKQALGLTDEQVAEALKERSQRIYDKYGTLMLNTEGMTADGIERKATCRWVDGMLRAKHTGAIVVGTLSECDPCSKLHSKLHEVMSRCGCAAVNAPHSRSPWHMAHHPRTLVQLFELHAAGVHAA
jgi:hypothetical protein